MKSNKNSNNSVQICANYWQLISTDSVMLIYKCAKILLIVSLEIEICSTTDVKNSNSHA